MPCPSGQITVRGACVPALQAAAGAGLEALGARSCTGVDRFLRALGFQRQCVDLRRFGLGAEPAGRAPIGGAVGLVAAAGVGALVMGLVAGARRRRR